MLAVILAPFYLLLNYYFNKRSLAWLKVYARPFKLRKVRFAYEVTYWTAATSLLTAFLLPQSQLQRVFKIVSNYWIGIFFCAVSLTAAADLVGLLCVKKGDRKNSKISFAAGAVILAAVFAFTVYGSIHARHVYTTSYQVKVEKSLPGKKSLKIVLIADLHLGYNSGLAQVRKIVEKTNEGKPDLVCIAGDIFDNEYRAVKNPEKIIKELAKINSTYGTYACWGNHDINEKILGGFTFGTKKQNSDDRQMREFLTRAGVKILDDKTILIGESFYLAGRKDPSKTRKMGSERKSPKELLKGCDLSKPVIVMDHEPKELEVLAGEGADLDLSGHTHDGQIFPGNLMTALMWENSCGYKKIGNMNSVVTSGAGVWGPPMRVGTKSEVCEITVRFTGK
ncbi:metallophosphoesterase [Anaerostipes sp.]|uniref:metallophosphoesterase n=1 Tax=Anaerostipes sp. TaxID=1872530 RepID=UPI0025B878FD|nr:metallophosphoesterase [Anaerostipes sp.]MBS7009732.1 metallophosphoesterase [Anaerostipes sp.]